MTYKITLDSFLGHKIFKLEKKTFFGWVKIASRNPGEDEKAFLNRCSSVTNGHKLYIYMPFAIPYFY
jgi:hypothetical protein